MLTYIILFHLIYYMYRVLRPFDLVFYKHYLHLKDHLETHKPEDYHIDIRFYKKIRNMMAGIALMKIQQLVEFVTLFVVFRISELSFITLLLILSFTYDIFGKDTNYQLMSKEQLINRRKIYRLTNVIDVIYYTMILYYLTH